LRQAEQKKQLEADRAILKQQFAAEEAAKKAGMSESKIFYCDSNDEVETFIKENWQDGDCILLKASNGMKFFEIANNLIKENV